MNLTCDICNKNYKSSQSLWNHNNRFHKKITNELIISSDTSSDINLTNKYNCDLCTRQFNNRQNKYKHEKICIKKDENYKIQIKYLLDEVKKLKSKSNKKIINFNGPINNNSINNLNICKPGDENINLLTSDENNFIISQGLNSIISLVDNLNFNERLPQHHNFCVSSINDKHVNILDKTTNNIIKQSKTDLFDQILFAHINKLENLASTDKDKKFNIVFNKLKAFIFLKQGKKEFVKQINMLSYNKRHTVLKTWKKLIGDDNFNPEDINKEIENKIKQLVNDSVTYSSDSDTDSIDSDISLTSYILPLNNMKKNTNIEV